MTVLEHVRTWWEGDVSVKRAVAFLAVLVVAYVAMARWPPQGAAGDGSLGISGLIEKVRNELAESERKLRKEGHESLFQLREMEMEIRYSVQAGGELKVESAGLAGTLDRSTEKAQTLRLKWDATAIKSGTAPQGGVSGPPTEIRKVPASSAGASAPRGCP